MAAAQNERKCETNLGESATIRSALSGRTMQKIAGDKSAVWKSNRREGADAAKEESAKDAPSRQRRISSNR